MLNGSVLWTNFRANFEYLKDSSFQIFHSLSSTDVLYLALSFKFGFSIHSGYPNHVKTSPVLTVHLVPNYTPVSRSASSAMNKRYPALQTVMSAMLLDSTYDVLTEVWACSSIPLACGSSPYESQILLPSLSQAVTIKVLPDWWAATFISDLYPSVYNHWLAFSSHWDLWSSVICMSVCMWRQSEGPTDFRTLKLNFLGVLYIIWEKNRCPQLNSLQL